MKKRHSHPWDKPRMTKKEQNIAIRKAKKEKKTAIDILFLLFEERAEQGYTVSLTEIERLHTQYINLGKTVEKTVYAAIRKFDEENGQYTVVFDKKNELIKFTLGRVAS